jgi:osmotically-inducible protein OsmY
MHKPNNILESDVKEELDWDPVLDDSRIVVKAKDGRVNLRGSVPTYFQATVASDDAWTVGGVKAVDNELLVGLVGEAIADADIEDNIAAALDADRMVPKGSVCASVTDGWVSLTGEVRHHAQRQAAEHAARKVDGVLGIANKVTISSDPIPSDVADRINKALSRNAIIDDSLIDVSNTDHTIFLDGTTTSYAARMAAENAAWMAPGVSDVIDRVVIV